VITVQWITEPTEIQPLQSIFGCLSYHFFYGVPGWFNQWLIDSRVTINTSPMATFASEFNIKSWELPRGKRGGYRNKLAIGPGKIYGLVHLVFLNDCLGGISDG